MTIALELYAISMFFSFAILIDLLVLIRYDKYTGEKVKLLNKSHDEDENVDKQSEKNVNVNIKIKLSIILIFIYSFIPLLNLLISK